MQDMLKKAIHQQRLTLAELLRAPMEKLAEQCAAVWGQREALDSLLSDNFLCCW